MAARAGRASMLQRDASARSRDKNLFVVFIMSSPFVLLVLQSGVGMEHNLQVFDGGVAWLWHHYSEGIFRFYHPKFRLMYWEILGICLGMLLK